eukprot:m.496226 g.496226  ORF g.496226 m.496226 type:complete len:70 (+) comp21808_c0_seq3:336-545(+)
MQEGVQQRPVLRVLDCGCTSGHLRPHCQHRTIPLSHVAQTHKERARQSACVAALEKEFNIHQSSTLMAE